MAEVEMKIRGLMMDPVTNMPIVVLKDVQGRLQAACNTANIPFVYWMQDFQSLEIDRMIAGRGAIMNIVVGGYYHGLDGGSRFVAAIGVAPYSATGFDDTRSQLGFEDRTRSAPALGNPIATPRPYAAA